MQVNARSTAACPDSNEAASSTTGRPASDWRLWALCSQTDPEAFFPDKGGSTRAGLAVCAMCSVRAECLDFALSNDERYGIWGGTTERERRRLRRDRRLSDEAVHGRPPASLPAARPGAGEVA